MLNEIDISKIKVGDKVRLGGEFEVTGIDEESSAWPIKIPVSTGVPAWLNRDWIVGHIPAPRPIEVGCRVIVGAGVNKHTVLAIDGGDAWIKNDDGYRRTALVSNLTRVD